MKTKKYNNNWQELSGYYNIQESDGNVHYNVHYSQQEIKDSNLPLGNYLGTRSKVGEDNLQRDIPMDVDNHLADIYLTGLERFERRRIRALEKGFEWKIGGKK